MVSIRWFCFSAFQLHHREVHSNDFNEGVHNFKRSSLSNELHELQQRRSSRSTKRSSGCSTVPIWFYIVTATLNISHILPTGLSNSWREAGFIPPIARINWRRWGRMIQTPSDAWRLIAHGKIGISSRWCTFKFRWPGWGQCFYSERNLFQEQDSKGGRGPHLWTEKVEQVQGCLNKSRSQPVLVCEMILIFHLITGSNKTDELAFIQYFEVTPPKDSIDTDLRCIFLRWETEDGVDYYLSPPYTPGIEVGKWYGIVPFASITSVYHLMTGNHPVHWFLSKLPWPANPFYVNRFYEIQH